MPAGAHYEGGGQWYINVGGGDPNSDDPSERPRRWRPERGSGFTQDDLPLPQGSRIDWTAYLLPSNPVDPLTQGLVEARDALQKPLCRALFAGTNAVSMLGTYISNGLITVGTSYPVAQRGGGTRNENFESADVGAVTSLGGAGSYANASGGRTSANPITVNRNGFFFTGRTSDGRDLTTLQGRGFEGLSLRQLRGAVLIHELLHAAGRLPHDKDNPTRSQKNSELVRRLCFPDARIPQERTTLSTQLFRR
jgi:hypothetical protein